MSDEALEVAAMWWWEQFRGAPKDAGASDFESAIASNLAHRLGGRHAMSESPAAFVHAVLAAYQREPFTFLEADYDPQPRLAELMRVAGINTQRCPWKTIMWLEDGRVTVSHGYRAPLETLWPRPAEVTS